MPVFSALNARDYFVAPVTLDRTNNEVDFIGLPFLAPAPRGLNRTGGPVSLLGDVSEHGRQQAAATGIVPAARHEGSGVLSLGDHR